MANQISGTTVTTGRVRLSYVHLFAPHSSKPGEVPKYKVTILIPKTDIATMQRINAAIQAATQKGIAGKWKGIRPVQVKNPVWDGDGIRQNGEIFGPECKGHWVMTATSDFRPEIIDLNMNPIMEVSAVYSGIYARVNVDFFPYSNSGNIGIGAGLGPIQKLQEGEPLGGRVSAAAAFGDDFSGYNPATPAVSYSQQFTAYSQQPLNNLRVPSNIPQQPAYNSQVFSNVPQQTSYNTQVPSYPQQNPMYPRQNVYQQPAYPTQPQQETLQQPVQYDPITSAPVTGGILGLNNDIPF